jgi:hypothetical protein
MSVDPVMEDWLEDHSRRLRQLERGVTDLERAVYDPHGTVDPRRVWAAEAISAAQHLSAHELYEWMIKNPYPSPPPKSVFVPGRSIVSAPKTLFEEMVSDPMAHWFAWSAQRKAEEKAQEEYRTKLEAWRSASAHMGSLMGLGMVNRTTYTKWLYDNPPPAPPFPPPMPKADGLDILPIHTTPMPWCRTHDCPMWLKFGGDTYEACSYHRGVFDGQSDPAAEARPMNVRQLGVLDCVKDTRARWQRIGG